jgi:CysZ protein
MFRTLTLAFASLSDKRIMLVLAKVIALTLVAFAILGVALWFGIDWLFNHFGLNDEGAISAIISLAILLVSGWLLFRSVAIAFTWIFSDDIIDAVEDKHYPFIAAQGQRPSFAKAATMGLRSLARVIGYNLLAVPVYLILLITGVGTALAFLIVNGYLLGRDLEDMLVMRHGADRVELGAIRRFVLGLGSVAAMLIPLVQMIVPVIATAAAVHMAHDIKEKI